jgi:hypothetical protein
MINVERYGGQPHHIALFAYFFCQDDVVYEKEKRPNSSSSSSIISHRSWMSIDAIKDIIILLFIHKTNFYSYSKSYNYNNIYIF